MAERKATIKRTTKETDVLVEINLDGEGKYQIDTGIGFFDHMLTHLSKHSKIDLKVQAKGDLHVDAHHTVEDVAICIGQAIDQALGDKRGITRYGNASVPMEEALTAVSIDLSGRAKFVYNAQYGSEKIGDFDVECIEEMLAAFTNNAKCNLHVNVSYGTNSHHIAEAIFKAMGQSLGLAVKIIGSDIPSTKGVL